jgi:KipI family sensor histidine kinase inhibitor
MIQEVYVSGLACPAIRPGGASSFRLPGWEAVGVTELEPLGDRAFLVQFPTEREAARWVSAVRGRGFRGVTDVVLAYRSAAVFADPDQVDLIALESSLSQVHPIEGPLNEGKLVEIPVLYDGPDLAWVAGRQALSPAEVIALHASMAYDVFAIGFLEGFPYAGYLPPCLSGLPRRDEPRLMVAAGSVAIAGRQTGIYPRESPGGWHLLGRTPVRFDVANVCDFPLRAGDRIQFRSIDANEFEARRHERL